MQYHCIYCKVFSDNVCKCNTNEVWCYKMRENESTEFTEIISRKYWSLAVASSSITDFVCGSACPPACFRFNFTTWSSWNLPRIVISRHACGMYVFRSKVQGQGHRGRSKFSSWLLRKSISIWRSHGSFEIFLVSCCWKFLSCRHFGS